MTIISMFLGIQSQFKVLHWQTQSYAKHQAYGEAYDTFSALTDDFIEIYMGKYGRLAVEKDDQITLLNIGEMDQDEFLDTIVDFLLSLNNQLNPQRDTDLLNLRDELLAAINKLKYLLTLK